MAATELPLGYEEYVVEEPDRVARILRYVIAFLVVTVLCVLLYALVVGVFAPPAPRTLIEASLLQSEAAVKADTGNGKAWAQLAAAQWDAGEKDQAWATLDAGRKKVKDSSLNAINAQTLSFLSVEGKDAEVIKRASGYIATAAKFKTEELNKNLGSGIQVPAELTSTQSEIELFVFQAASLGNLKRWKEAIKSLDYALELSPMAADLLALRGWAKLRSGDKKGAATDFQKALVYIPNDPSATQGLKEATAKSSSK